MASELLILLEIIFILTLNVTIIFLALYPEISDPIEGFIKNNLRRILYLLK